MSTPVYVEIEGIELAQVASELRASEVDVEKAVGRAMSRTARTLRARAARGLKTELELRNQKLIRRRLKSARLKRSKDGAFRLWFGANDIPVSAFKGRPRQTNTGASFRGVKFPGGFVRRGASGKRTILMRVGHSRRKLTEAKMPVQDQMNVFVQDEIWDQALDIFWLNFKRDLRARTIYGVG
ncbi:MAG: hypothetical protein PF501_19070 [Salinisphaera sp.]|jgi:hypothetical protein|nr:hypothetical protein [Salinisphaera sp.]